MEGFVIKSINKNNEKQERKGYHITKKSNLYSIQKNGLQPRIGRRSNSVDEYKKLLCFTDNFNSIFIWKKRLYENTSLDDLAILTFDLSDIGYGKRYDSAGDCFIEHSILPEKINLINLIGKYNYKEFPLIECVLEKPELTQEQENEIVEKLANYEHQKWSEEYSRLEWKANRTKDGNLEIEESDTERMQKYMKLAYEQAEEFYHKEIKDKVMESFFILQENHIMESLGVSEEELISTLEYDRRNRWSEYMLSLCTVKNGKYIIPKEKAELWKKEMQTPYSDLSEKQKESDRK